MMLFICTVFHKNVLSSFKVIERTRFPCLSITREHNYVNHIRGIAIYVLCTSSDDVLLGQEVL